MMARRMAQKTISKVSAARNKFAARCHFDHYTVFTVAGLPSRDARIRVVTLPTNSRLPTALNMGFREAKGRHFTWISADCFMCVYARSFKLVFHNEVSPSVNSLQSILPLPSASKVWNSRSLMYVSLEPSSCITCAVASGM